MFFQVTTTKSGRIALVLENNEIGVQIINAATQMIFGVQGSTPLLLNNKQETVSQDGRQLSKEIAEIKLQLAESAKPKKSQRELKEEELSLLSATEVRKKASTWAKAYMNLNGTHPAKPWNIASAILKKETGFDVSVHKPPTRSKSGIDIIQENGLLVKYAAILFDLSDRVG